MRKWSKVSVGDNWGTLEYSLDGEKFESSAFLRADIRWPDSLVEEEKDIWHKPVCERVSDMGHEYDVHTEKLLVRTVCHGIQVEIDLSKVEVDKESVVWSKPEKRRKS